MYHTHIGVLCRDCLIAFHKILFLGIEYQSHDCVLFGVVIGFLQKVYGHKMSQFFEVFDGGLFIHYAKILILGFVDKIIAGDIAIFTGLIS